MEVLLVFLFFVLVVLGKSSSRREHEREYDQQDWDCY